jgi:4-carboxymuconolactone decarboxylase
MAEQQTPAQRLLVEALTHLAFYAGWPSGMAALAQLKTIIADASSGASR